MELEINRPFGFKVTKIHIIIILLAIAGFAFRIYELGALNTFFIASPFKLFDINEVAAHLPSVLFGTLTILLVFFVGSKWGNRRIGIIAAFLTAISVWEIACYKQEPGFGDFIKRKIVTNMESCERDTIRVYGWKK